MTLEQIIADWREEANRLKRIGRIREAEDLEHQADLVAGAGEPWLRRLNEADARMKSGKSIRWLRAKAQEWATIDCAWRIDGQWYFRDCIIPQRQHRTAVAEDARRTAREQAS